MRYKQLTLEKRYHISALQKAGLNQKEVANELGVHPSTISRELRRNNDKIRGYNAELAQIISTKTEMQKRKRHSLTKPIEKYIRAKLKQDWSPEQISGRMKLDTGVSVVHETIYRYIYTNKKNGGKLYQYLRHKNKKYHKRSNDYMARGTIIDRIMIDKRPKIVEKKSRIGDWEIDTVVGKDHKGFLVTVVDRKSKFAIIKNVPTKHAEVVTQALIEMLTPMKKITHTITSDNGKEFAYHKQVVAALNTDFYFANPYHSWERGLNEHTNGLIRQYLPKKSTFLNVSKDEIIMIQNRLNNRPRKILGYKTPYEVFFSEMSKKLAS
ncbi:IS30 family transposase [Sulfurimonas sp. NW7]|uniref:IS30 family transposase n=1 Tax=Sulfurimonas sp. NW7 TaxID=2922727 RepID=UPI003DA86825